jgi:hypothetical protein
VVCLALPPFSASLCHGHPKPFAPSTALAVRSPVENFQFRFASECVAQVALCTLTAAGPSYSTILELDRKTRKFPIPEDALTAAQSDMSAVPQEHLTPSLSMQRCVLAHVQEVSEYPALSCPPSSVVHPSELLCPGDHQ